MGKKLNVYYTDGAIKSFMLDKIMELNYLGPKGFVLSNGIGSQCARLYRIEKKEIEAVRLRREAIEMSVTIDVIQFLPHFVSSNIENSWLELRVEDPNYVDLGQTMAKKLAEILNVRIVLPKVLNGPKIGSINCQYCGQISTNLDKCTHCGARPI